jgi:hypothetical protein
VTGTPGDADTSVIVDMETQEDGHGIRLEDTLLAFREQTRADRLLEVLVVAPRPATDAEGEAMAGLPARWLVRPGLRYYDLKNAGIAESRGRFVVLADSDTVTDRDFLEVSLRHLDRAGGELAAVTGRTRFVKGPFSREVAIAQLPNQSTDAGDTKHFLAHNVAFRGDVLREDSFRGGHIRLFADTDLATRLIAKGFRIEYEPRMGVTHNYAREWREISAHCAVIGYHDARFRSFLGERRRGAFLDAAGRFRTLVGRFFRLRKAMGISRWRAPLSILFFAWYSRSAARGYAASLRGEPEPFAEF